MNKITLPNWLTSNSAVEDSESYNWRWHVNTVLPTAYLASASKRISTASQLDIRPNHPKNKLKQHTETHNILSVDQWKDKTDQQKAGKKQSDWQKAKSNRTDKSDSTGRTYRRVLQMGRERRSRLHRLSVLLHPRPSELRLLQKQKPNQPIDQISTHDS